MWDSLRVLHIQEYSCLFHVWHQRFMLCVVCCIFDMKCCRLHVLHQLLHIWRQMLHVWLKCCMSWIKLKNKEYSWIFLSISYLTSTSHVFTWYIACLMWNVACCMFYVNCCIFDVRFSISWIKPKIENILKYSCPFHVWHEILHVDVVLIFNLSHYIFYLSCYMFHVT